MKYLILAKIVGTLMPERVTTINDCKIQKDSFQLYLDDDRPLIPIREREFEYHGVERGVRNFIYYPQTPISSRTIESQYTISTEINGQDSNLYLILDKANKKFTEVKIALSLALKTTVKKVGTKRYRRDGYYDFEIIAIFIKNGGKFIRIKLPKPLVNGHNYFPELPPKGFVKKVKNFLEFRDPVFKKGLEYITNASKMNYSGNFSHLEKILNLLKCIELISSSLNIGKIIDKKTGKKREPYTKELFTIAGDKIGVTKENIRYAKKAWEARNNADIAHKHLYRPYDDINYDLLDKAASDYLIQYFKWSKDTSQFLF